MNVDLVTLFMGVITAVALGGIPWAYKIHGRLVSIETTLEHGLRPPDWLKNKVEDNAQAIMNLRNEIEKSRDHHAN